MIDSNNAAFIIIGVYVVILTVGHILTIFLYLDDGDDFSTGDKIGIGLLITFWPLTGPVVGSIFAIEKRKEILAYFLRKLGQLLSVRRRMIGRYWTLRAKIAKEEDGFTWDR